MRLCRIRTMLIALMVAVLCFRSRGLMAGKMIIIK